MVTFIINDIAAISSGALTVLKDCVDYIEANPSTDTEYHLFTSVDVFDSMKNVCVHRIKKKGWISRIIWDNGGLQKWCQRNRLVPDLIISLQNTSTKYITEKEELVQQLVYYHHPFPLISYKWNIFKKQELIFFLFSIFYSFFVKRNNKSSYYVLQLSCTRELFLEKFKKINRERVHIICPDAPVIDLASIPEIPLMKEFIYFFYPATALTYKNHKVIIQALALLRQRFSPILNNIKIIFTVDKLASELMRMIRKYNLLEVIHLIGQRPYSEILSYYKSVNVLLFPSQFETFGLPLIEASCFGLPIIASDLVYAAEVLKEYDNKILLDSESVFLWADAIENYKAYKKISPHFSHSLQRNSWSTFFELANGIIKGIK
jgi:glycosyltransferase involved in cell wall biosynthesis